MSELMGNKEIGLIAAKSLLGNSLGNVMGGIISLLLISTISSMIFTGPRVMKSMFSRIPKLNFLGKSAKDGTPRVAIIAQSILSLILMFTMNFESLIYYVAFTLSLFTLLTVFGLFVLRYKQGKPSGYKAWGYPLTPIVFVVMTSGVAYYFIKDRPIESVLGLSTSVLGLIFYFLFASKKSKPLN
jgi:APA family basic amino acid/polyamine antiporter